ncbi:MAG TPA: hypothetical protein P5257_06320 [Bacteroidales bacterium]|nr:hypothetical protein [Bacteroidales bacterium]HRT89719.1 hypothetical protein [Bacteroidales bacterium]
MNPETGKSMKYRFVPLIRRLIIPLLFLTLLILPFACDDDYVLMPKLTTLKAEDADITTSSALLKGRIIWTGNQKILEYGIELSKTALFNPSDTNSIKHPPDTGIFSIPFTGLEPGTQYFFKAYVLINTAQVYSQNVEKFTTKSE